MTVAELKNRILQYFNVVWYETYYIRQCNLFGKGLDHCFKSSKSPA